MDVYSVSGRIGEGAHGLVLRGRNTITGQEVALKKITLKKPNSGIPIQVIREIKCLQIVDCENVVPLLDVFPQGLGFVLVFEYMPSELWEMIYDAESCLDEPQIKSYTMMLLKGVAYLHEHNIMHRDLKPANLLIDKEGILKIADLGLGRLFSRAQVAYSHQVATRWYRAPELLYGARFYTEAIDMWSVGCILAEMVNKTPLFPGESDIEQLVIVLHILGTPTEAMWPGMRRLPDYNKISFPHSRAVPFQKLFPDASEETLGLLSKLLLYDSASRLSAKVALTHPYFFSSPLPCSLSEMPKPGEGHRKHLAEKGEYVIEKPIQDLFEELSNLFTGP